MRLLMLNHGPALTSIAVNIETDRSGFVRAVVVKVRPLSWFRIDTQLVTAVPAIRKWAPGVFEAKKLLHGQWKINERGMT